MFLKSFEFPSYKCEEKYLNNIKMTCYNTMYPFKVLIEKELNTVDFEPITIFHGGNGCGKTTVLNVIAEKLKLRRFSLYNRSNFFDEYLKFCDNLKLNDITSTSKIITSDDVFDYMIDMRYLNEGVHREREKIFDEYTKIKNENYSFDSLDDYENLKKRNAVKKTTKSKFVSSNLNSNINQKSNGENAYLYFVENIVENGLYILDEPENSLSPENQLKLVAFIEESVRFFNCQFIISTHSPFLLALKDAKIYDLDKSPSVICNWKELDNIKIYEKFFREKF